MRQIECIFIIHVNFVYRLTVEELVVNYSPCNIKQKVALSRGGQTHELLAVPPQLGRLLVVPGLGRHLPHAEPVPLRGRRVGVQVVVVVQTSAALQLGRGDHVHEAVAAALHALRDVEDLVRGEVEHLDEQRVLVAEETVAYGTSTTQVVGISVNEQQ
jgi:hypothetical protein